MYDRPFFIQQHQSSNNIPSERFSNQLSTNSVSYLLHIFATNLVFITVKSRENAKRPTVVPTYGTKLKMMAEFEAGK